TGAAGGPQQQQQLGAGSGGMSEGGTGGSSPAGGAAAGAAAAAVGAAAEALERAVPRMHPVLWFRFTDAATYNARQPSRRSRRLLQDVARLCLAASAALTSLNHLLPQLRDAAQAGAPAAAAAVPAALQEEGQQQQLQQQGSAPGARSRTLSPPPSPTLAVRLALSPAQMSLNRLITSAQRGQARLEQVGAAARGETRGVLQAAFGRAEQLG
ncbi:hypothetical protein Agub_g4666, partial [Astrephomene gubernaculifera]